MHIKYDFQNSIHLDKVKNESSGSSSSFEKCNRGDLYASRKVVIYFQYFMIVCRSTEDKTEINYKLDI